VGCDGLLCVSQATARSNADLCPGVPVHGALGAVALERFAPGPAPPRVRQGLGLAPEHRVVGIVARVQPHRRFDLLLEAARRWLAGDPRGRLLIVGRGTHLDAVARRPAARLGIADRVVFAGYRDADYPDVLRAVDVFTLLVPGSDGTCRALLEAAACALPAVTTRRGALPEIVLDGRTGFTVDEHPDALSAAWRRLLDDAELRHRLGRQARERAEHQFQPARLAADVAALYRAARAGAMPPTATQAEADSCSFTSSR
jgi:glycosyltransferase involved in cell wall biosynthesis